MKKILSIAIVLVFALSLMSVATFTASAESTLIYKFTFENGGDTILVKAGEAVGEVVEWPAGSGNHCLKYQMDSTTHTGAGVHPYIWPQGINGILRGQGMLGAGETYDLTIDIAVTGNTQGSYMYPFLLCNGELDDESYFDKSTFSPSGSFQTHTFTLSSLVAEPLADQESGGIAFVDEQTLDDGEYVYIDNVTFVKNGAWKPLEPGSFCAYRDGTPADEGYGVGDAPVNPSQEPTSNEPTSNEPTSNEPTSDEPSGEPSEVKAGDADGDGQLSMKDVLVIRKLIAGILTGEVPAADVDGDGNVTMKDVLLVRKAIAGIVTL